MNNPKPLARLPAADLPDLLSSIRARTPARILVGRAGPAYRTATQLQLRQDHAAALDAVHEELNLDKAFVEGYGLVETCTLASNKLEYLMRPDLGRHLNDQAQAVLLRECPLGADLQVAIGDGLSAAAVTAQVPNLLPLLEDGCRQRGWRFGRPFVIRYCRVGVLNDVGAALDPLIVVLLIGERPGLATADSLSAYLAYRPQSGHTDAQRNLISNIHGRGVDARSAARRIMALAAMMRQMQSSGVTIKEDLQSLAGDQ
jgi:ethanolamine ammonia-lyase small subunit